MARLRTPWRSRRRACGQPSRQGCRWRDRRSPFPRPSHEAFEQPLTHARALLRVELYAEQSVAADDRGNVGTVLRGREHDIVFGIRDVRVHEVEVPTVGDAREPRVRRADTDTVPTGMRHARAVAETAHRPAIEPETGRIAVFLAGLEEQLHADAKSEKRDLASARLAHGDVEPEPMQFTTAVPEVADAWQHHGAGADDLAVIARDADVTHAGAAKGALDAGEIADPVVDDRDHQPMLGCGDQRHCTACRRGGLWRALAAFSRFTPHLLPRRQTCALER